MSKQQDFCCLKKFLNHLSFDQKQNIKCTKAWH